MPDSNQTPTTAAPVTQSPMPTPAPAPAATAPAGAPAPAAGQPPAQAALEPLSYKDMIIEAWRLAKINNGNILKVADILTGMGEKYEGICRELDEKGAEIYDLKKQLAAIYLVSADGKPLTSDNVASKIMEEEKMAMKSQLDKSVENKTIVPVESVSKESDIVWFSYKDGGAGYQSLVGWPEAERPNFIGKKVGDTVKEVTIEGIFAVVAKPQPETQPTGSQDGQNQSQEAAAQTAQVPSTTGTGSTGDQSTAQAPQAPAPTP